MSYRLLVSAIAVLVTHTAAADEPFDYTVEPKWTAVANAPKSWANKIYLGDTVQRLDAGVLLYLRGDAKEGPPEPSYVREIYSCRTGNSSWAWVGTRDGGMIKWSAMVGAPVFIKRPANDPIARVAERACKEKEKDRKVSVWVVAARANMTNLEMSISSIKRQGDSVRYALRYIDPTDEAVVNTVESANCSDDTLQVLQRMRHGAGGAKLLSSSDVPEKPYVPTPDSASAAILALACQF